MLLSFLIIIPILGIFILLTQLAYNENQNVKVLKITTLTTTIIDLLVSLAM
jgi:hypothetical protein